MAQKIETFDEKYAHFGSFDGPFLTTLEVQKDIFWTFSKLFWSCLRSVRALFLTLKGPLLDVFSALKVDK